MPALSLLARGVAGRHESGPGMSVAPDAERSTWDGQVAIRGVFAWAFVAQGFSSATNFGLAVVAGHALGPAHLGIITVGFAGYLLVAGLQRAIVLQPTIAYGASRSADERRSLAECGLTVGIVRPSALRTVARSRAPAGALEGDPLPGGPRGGGGGERLCAFHRFGGEYSRCHCMAP